MDLPHTDLDTARRRRVCLALILITLLAYLPLRHHGFVLYDDPEYVTENRTVQAGLTWAGVKWAFTTFHASNWHPLTWLSHMLDCELFGLDAGAHHLVNVALHAANAVLLFLLLGRLTGGLWPAALVAALFAWHPLRVESVAWAAERKDVLSGLFFLLTLGAYAKYVSGERRRTNNQPPTTNIQHPMPGAADRGPQSAIGHRPSAIWYGCALALFALGLMAKPMLVTLPFVLLLLDYWPLGRMGAHSTSRENPGNEDTIVTHHAPRTTLPSLILKKTPFFLLSALSGTVTFLAQRGEAVVALERVPLYLRLQNAVVSGAKYLIQTVWPSDLAVFYPLPKQIPLAETAAAALALGAISWLAWRTRRQKPHLLAGWCWYLITLVPVIGLVQVGGQAMADRYTYIPLIGVVIAVVFEAAPWVARLRFPPLAVIAASGLVLVACLAATARQLRYWQNSEALFARAVAVTPDNAISRINLGVALEQQHRNAEALVQYEEALRLDPRRVQVHNNLGNLLDALGQTDAALAQYQEAVRLRPDAPLARCNLGTLLVKRGQFGEALMHYAEAARLAPDDPRPHCLMGKAAQKQGRSPEAAAHFREALRVDPNDPQAATYLARLLASDADPQLRSGAEAVALAERANALTGGEQPFVLDTLAMAYAEAGRFSDAQSALEKALALAAAGTNENLSALQKRQALYRLHQPYREAPGGAPPAK